LAQVNGAQVGICIALKICELRVVPQVQGLKLAVEAVDLFKLRTSGKIQGPEIIVRAPYSLEMRVPGKIPVRNVIVQAPESAKLGKKFNPLHGPYVHVLAVDVSCPLNLIRAQSAVTVPVESPLDVISERRVGKILLADCDSVSRVNKLRVDT
jgi:hypothetical protein